MSEKIILSGTGIKKFLKQDKLTLEILKTVSFEIPQGSFTVLVGPSGSGKSTLLGIIAGIDNADMGIVVLDGQDITHMKESQLAKIRNDKIGIVFQNYNLIPTLTALENVEVPLFAANTPSKEIRKKAEAVLELVGLSDRKSHRPNQLSGGQQQRVAIARALVTDPVIVVADEPTGNLDSKNGQMILDLLSKLQKDMGLTLVIATHDMSIAAKADQIISIKDGQIVK